MDLFQMTDFSLFCSVSAVKIQVSCTSYTSLVRYSTFFSSYTCQGGFRPKLIYHCSRDPKALRLTKCDCEQI